jgi:hypothetical protein
MMMQMLEAGGMPLLVDAHRPPDASNPQGYYEYAPVKRLLRDASWLDRAEGRAVKVVAPLVAALPADRRYAVILMQRPLEEVLRSQARMLARLEGARPEADDAARLRAALTSELAQCRAALAAAAHCALLEVAYHEAIAAPRAIADRVADFVAGTRRLDREAMAGAVSPALHRERGAR